jgi:hypothetical protein
MPNKCWDYLAAGIPTIGYNPGRSSRIYTSGGWGVVLEEHTVEGIRKIEEQLPTISETLRQSQVMDVDIPKLRRLVGYVLQRTRRRKRAVVTVLENFSQTKGDGSMILRVKPGFSIPRVVKIAFDRDVTFNPDAELPEDVGKLFLKNLPNVFEVAVGKPDPGRYPALAAAAETPQKAKPSLDLTEQEIALVLAHRAKEAEAKKAEETPAPAASLPSASAPRARSKATAKR